MVVHTDPQKLIPHLHNLYYILREPVLSVFFKIKVLTSGTSRHSMVILFVIYDLKQH